MGANAQTAVPAFTAGQVLTAAQQTQINTGIPVFATTVTRDAAFGGAGEKTLAEGQFAYIEATDTTQYYDGAAWQAVGASSGLTLISSTTIGTTVTSVALTNIFSATYDNYLIQMSGGVASATSDGNFILGATTTGYYSSLVYNGYSAGTPLGVVTTNAVNAGTIWGYSANGINLEMTMFQPFAAKRTSYVYQSATITTTGNRWVGGGFVDNATSYTGMTFAIQAGSGHTITGGTIKVYGLANSQDFMTYKIQIDNLVRDATADEATQIDAQIVEAQAQTEVRQAKIAARQAVLDKLGLTADEAAALLGQFGNTRDIDRLRNNTRQHTYR